MKSTFVILLIVLASTLSQAQPVKISLAAGVNMPFINNVIQPRIQPLVNPTTGFMVSTVNFYIDQKYTTGPGIQASVNGTYNLNNKWSFSSGLGITHYRYTQKLVAGASANFVVTSGFFSTRPSSATIINGTPVGMLPDGTYRVNLSTFNTPAFTTPADQGETRVSYLTLPAMAEYAVAKKWNVSAGVQAHVIMMASVMRYTYAYSGWNNTNTVQAEDRSADGFTNVLLSGVVQVRYQVASQFSIDLGYSYTPTPIYDQPLNSTTNQQARYMALHLSARYWLKH